MKDCHYGEGSACGKGWLQVHLPVELTFNQKLWRLLIPLFSWACDPALGAVCYFVHVCETPRNWQLDMSVTAAITPVPYKTSLCRHPVIHLVLNWTEPQPELPVICVGDDLASVIWLAELWGLNLWKQRLQKMHSVKVWKTNSSRRLWSQQCVSKHLIVIVKLRNSALNVCGF